MKELPRDVVLKIASYMDIDTRRALGIYTKLHVPDEIKSKLEAVIPHPTRLIFDPNYKKIMLKAPLVQTCIDHYGKIIMKQPSY